MDSGEFRAIPDELATEIAAEFSDEVSKALHVTSLALANGHAKPADVFAMYANNAPIREAVQTLLRRGTIKLAI